MTPFKRMKLALLRAKIELDYCHSAMGPNRRATRADTIRSLADGLAAADEIDPTIVRDRG